MAEITEAEIERLSLIRYQLLVSAEQVRQPPPINVLAINSMQDVVESALGAVAEHVRADVKARSDFDKLLDAVTLKLGSPPELAGMRSSAIALNNARVGFKHHGNQLRDETLRRHYDVAVTLVHELVRVAFGTELDDISMLAFVKHEDVRKFIEKADEFAQKNDIINALSYLRSAFDLAVDDYANRKSLDGWRSIFDVSPRSSTHVSGGDWGWERPFREFQGWVEALDKRVKLSAMGIDLSRYAYFDAVAPTHTRLASDERGPHAHVRFENPTGEHYEASYIFVVDSAIRLAASDFNLARAADKVRPVETYDPGFKSEKYLRDAEKNAAMLKAWQDKQNTTNDER